MQRNESFYVYSKNTFPGEYKWQITLLKLLLMEIRLSKDSNLKYAYDKFLMKFLN